MAEHRKVQAGKRVKVATAVYRKPNGKYLATYVDPGHKRHWKEFETKNGAVRWRALALVDPSAVIESKRPLTELFEECLARGRKQPRPTTLANWRQIWNKHVDPNLGYWPVSKVHLRNVEDFFDDRLKEGVGAPTLEKCRLLMVRTFDYALTHGEARVNPLRLGSGIEPFVNSEPHKARTLSSDEIGRILEAARGRNVADALLVELMYFAGLRIGEAFGLQAGDVDLVAHTLTINRTISEPGGRLTVGPTKTGKARTLHLDPGTELWRDVERFVRGKGAVGAVFLFTGPRGANLRPNNWRRRVWSDLMEKAKIADPPSPHSGRRTAATRMSEAGVDILTTKRVLGHSISGVTEGYIDTSPDALREALRKAAE